MAGAGLGAGWAACWWDAAGGRGDESDAKGATVGVRTVDTKLPQSLKQALLLLLEPIENQSEQVPSPTKPDAETT